MVTSRYATVNGKILTLVRHGSLSRYYPPPYSKQEYSRAQPHPENERQQSVNRASTERQQYLVLQFVLPIKAANNSSMTDYNLSEV